jgi:hypothetical protein
MARVSLVVLAVALTLGLNFCMARSCGVMPVRDCPEQTLASAEVEALYLKGVAATDEGMMGEYRLISSIEDGIPMLKTAALHGHRPAIDRLGSHFIQTGVLEMISLDGLLQPDAAAEGMMWHILEVHLKGEIPRGDDEVFRVLLDPSIPFPDGFFESSTGTAWMFQMLTTSGLEYAREQAHAWSRCWGE